MSDSPILSKMDALMKKHRGGGDAPEARPGGSVESDAPPVPAADAPPAGAWLPVLTQIIERGSPPVATASPTPREAAPDSAPPAPDAVQPRAAEPVADPAEFRAVEAVDPAAANQPNAAESAPAIVSSELSEQLMSELTPRLSEVMEKQLAAELRKNLDQTVATLLSQLDVNVREIVREAVAEKLNTPPRDPSR